MKKEIRERGRRILLEEKGESTLLLHLKKKKKGRGEKPHRRKRDYEDSREGKGKQRFVFYCEEIQIRKARDLEKHKKKANIELGVEILPSILGPNC